MPIQRGWSRKLLAPRWGWALLAVPLALLVLIALLRMTLGQGHTLLPLLALAPAAGAMLGGAVYTLAVGAAAIGEEEMLDAGLRMPLLAEPVVIAFIAIAGVTIGGAVACYLRERRERELSDVRAVADVTQRVLLRPVPEQAGPVRLAARYDSAACRARVGGDLYAAVATEHGVRLIVGDAEGKGLAAVQEAATAMGVFRQAAHDQGSLTGIVERLEVVLGRELGEEQFITAVLAEVSPDGGKMQLINCGHPQPLQLGGHRPHLLGPADGSLPLGLGMPGDTARIPFRVPLAANEPVLFYTDGLTEARNSSGEMFPVAESAALRCTNGTETLLERLSAEVRRHIGGQPLDDIALLLVERQPEPG